VVIGALAKRATVRVPYFGHACVFHNVVYARHYYKTPAVERLKLCLNVGDTIVLLHQGVASG
jgi:hypothetical protein